MKLPFPFLEENAFEFYTSTYRRDGLPPLEISKPLDLFPDSAPEKQFEIELTWRNPWPYATRAGVYLVYDAAAELIYIGKAVVLGNRLSTYFGGGSECVYREQWGVPPKYVRVIAVPSDMPFEAPALEAYLISRLRPKLNTLGIN